MVRIKNTHTAAVILSVAGVKAIQINPGAEALIQSTDWELLTQHPGVSGRVRDGSLVVGEIEKIGKRELPPAPVDEGTGEDDSPAPKRKRSKSKR